MVNALQESLDREAEAARACFDSQDKNEGIRAFFEKRKPGFRGR